MLVIPNVNNWRKNLPEEVISDIKHHLVLKKYKANEFIYSTGDVSNGGFQIITGKIKVCHFSESGDELILSNLHHGDCFGDIGLITNKNRVNYAIACRDTSVNFLSRFDYKAMSIKHPIISTSINELLCFRLLIMFEMIEDAYLLPLYNRLAKALIKLALSRGKMDQEENIIVSNISQESLGQMVGATRQSIGRELKKLELECFVTIKYGKLKFPNLNDMIEHFQYTQSSPPIVSSYPDETG